MIILVTGMFPKEDKYGYISNEKELLVSHGYDTTTGATIVLPNEHPGYFNGVYFDKELSEWVLSDS